MVAKMGGFQPMADDPTANHKFSPELKRLIAENLQVIGEHVAAGWSWDQNTLTHHDDPDIHYWIEPYTQKAALSPKLAEAIAMGRLPRLKPDRGEGMDNGH
jgi:hypothetical protein